MKEESGFHIDYEAIARVLSGEADAEEERRVQNWAQENHDNRELFASLKLMWEETSSEHFTTDPSFSPDTNAAWEKVKLKTTSPKSNIRPIRRWLQAVAAIIIFIAAGISYFRSLNQPPQMVEHKVDHTEKLALADGSVVHINSGSDIRYAKDFGKKDRKVELKGEAFFEVEPDTSKPFIVQSLDMDIRVVGTSFNVLANNPDSVVVSVETGKVEMRFENGFILLHPGETGVYYRNGHQLFKRGEIPVINQFWRDRRLVFRKTPLQEVIRIVNESYGVHIQLENPEMRDQPITVRFRDQDLQTVLEVLSATLNMQYETTGPDEFLLIRNTNE
ncbi:MAG: DUF4974 domain-containing protein [Bacteroidetes bacterium]|nr:DUF4974 domain-containing protein [Bacteroidota bacterium]